VALSAEPAATLWAVPVETVSQSDEGLERNRQGTSVLFSWPGELAPGETRDYTIGLRLSKA
jgi:alpha-amylase